MPYLHWETDRRRVRAADVVKKTTNAKWSAFDDLVEDTARTVIEGSFNRITSDGLLQRIPTKTVQTRRKSVTAKITSNSVQGQKLLGRMLLLAAALYEAMDAYSERPVLNLCILLELPCESSYSIY